MKKKLKETYVDSIGFIRSLWILAFRDIRKLAIFSGFKAYEIAQKYANKRTAKWSNKWDQLGKQQFIMPFSDISIIVCSKLELKALKKKGLIKKQTTIRKVTKHSFYKTEL